MLKRFKNLLLENRSPKQTVVKNFFWLTVGQISRILRMLIIIYAARVLGATEYGLFSYILSILGILSIFADIGLSSLLVRETASHPEKRASYFATTFWLKMFLIFLTALAIVIIGPHISKFELGKPLLYLAALWVIFDNAKEIFLAYLRGLAKMELETLVVTLTNFVMAVAGFFILVSKPSAQGLLSIYVLSALAALIASIILIQKILPSIIRHFNKTLAREILKNCWPIALSGAAGMLMLNVDTLMLGFWRTPAEIGFYSAGQKIIWVLYTLPGLLGAAIFPTLAAIVSAKDRLKEKILNEKTITLVFIFSLPIVLGGIILAKPIFSFIYGPEYLAGVNAFQILLLNALLIFPGIIFSNLVLAHNQQKDTVKFIIYASLLNIVLNTVLIPRIGIIGAALASLAAQIVNFVLIWHLIKKISYFEIWPHLRKIITGTLAMGAVSFILNQLGLHVLANILLSGGIYLGLLYLLREKTVGELFFMTKH